MATLRISKGMLEHLLFGPEKHIHLDSAKAVMSEDAEMVVLQIHGPDVPAGAREVNIVVTEERRRIDVVKLR